MSLRTTILTLLAGVVLLFLGAVFAIQRAVILPSYLALEDDTARRDAARVASAIENELLHLDAFTADWAAWDDTYAFVADGNAAYVEANLSDAYFADGSFNAAYYVDLDRRVVHGTVRDPASGHDEVAVGAFAGRVWPADHPALANRDIARSTTGIVPTEHGPLLVVSRPIVTSQKQGPMRGWIVLGRFVTDAMLESLRQQTALDFALLPWDGELAGADADGRAALAAGTATHLARVADEHMVAYGCLRDLAGRPVLLVRTAIAREISARGNDALAFALWSTAGASLLLLLVLIWALGTFVTRPLARLTAHAVRIGESDDLR
jgi:sensor domain CHASE-containing protein